MRFTVKMPATNFSPSVAQHSRSSTTAKLNRPYAARRTYVVSSSVRGTNFQNYSVRCGLFHQTLGKGPSGASTVTSVTSGSLSTYSKPMQPQSCCLVQHDRHDVPAAAERYGHALLQQKSALLWPIHCSACFATSPNHSSIRKLPQCHHSLHSPLPAATIMLCRPAREARRPSRGVRAAAARCARLRPRPPPAPAGAGAAGPRPARLPGPRPPPPPCTGTGSPADQADAPWLVQQVQKIKAEGPEQPRQVGTRCRVKAEVQSSCLGWL